MYDFAIGLLVILAAVVVYAYVDEYRSRRAVKRAAAADDGPDFPSPTIHDGVWVSPLDCGMGGQR